MVSVCFILKNVCLVDEQNSFFFETDLDDVQRCCWFDRSGIDGFGIFKGGRARAAMSGFGAGVGAGLSWEEVHKNLGNLFERN